MVEVSKLDFSVHLILKLNKNEEDLKKDGNSRSVLLFLKGSFIICCMCMYPIFNFFFYLVGCSIIFVIVY